MKGLFYVTLLYTVLGCTKDLEDKINILQASNEELKKQLNLLNLQMTSYEAQLQILEYQAANPQVSFDSPYVGCWKSTDSIYDTEIQILPNGVGTLDFGTAVYQVFSWGVYEGQTILHFGGVSWCSCFGITEEGFLFGEMFEEDQPLAIVGEDVIEAKEFSLNDFENSSIQYNRCELY